MIQRAEQRPTITFLGSFSRSQVSAGIATAVDYALLFSLVEISHVWYVIAVALGALAGAVTNFVLNRYWSFDASEGRWSRQAWRYVLVSGTSLLLNTGGVWLLTDRLRLHYYYSVFIVSTSVGFFFNYPLHRFFVFREREQSTKEGSRP